MALQVSVRNINPLGDVIVHHPELPGGRLSVAAGEVIKVSPELAGQGPSPDGSDLGSGLLAQLGNWEPVDESASAKSTTKTEGAGAK
jgi:hypothetical protein